MLVPCGEIPFIVKQINLIYLLERACSLPTNPNFSSSRCPLSPCSRLSVGFSAPFSFKNRRIPIISYFPVLPWRKLPSTRRLQHGERGGNGIPNQQIHARGQGAQSQCRLLAAGCIVGRIHLSPPVLQVQNTPRPVVGRSYLDRGMGMSLSFLALAPTYLGS